MFIKSITIEFEAIDASDDGHATKMTLHQGKWTADGPVFSRFGLMAHEVWQVIRRQAVEQNKETHERTK